MADSKHWLSLAAKTRAYMKLPANKSCAAQIGLLRALASQLQTARVKALAEGDQRTAAKASRSQRSLHDAQARFDKRCLRDG